MTEPFVLRRFHAMVLLREKLTEMARSAEIPGRYWRDFSTLDRDLAEIGQLQRLQIETFKLEPRDDF